MPRETILVVDDQEDLLKLLEYNLSAEGLRVVCATTGEDGLAKAAELLPDLIVLDLMLPGIDGFEVCRLLKQDDATRHIPVLMLTAKGEETDIVVGLELGAEDYVTKPFSPRVLVARIRAALRRKRVTPADAVARIRVGDLRIHPGRHEASVGGEAVPLTPTQFAILHLLAQHPGWVFTRHQIINETRGEDYPVTDRSVDAQIVGLRRNLGAAGRYIETVRGVGYRFNA